VRVTVGPASRNAFAMYLSRPKSIEFNRDFVRVSTWMLAAVLAHELKHASDDRARIPWLDASDCIPWEQRAYQEEADFVRWLSSRFVGFPSEQQVRNLLAPEDQVLFSNLRRIATAPDPTKVAYEDYLGHCLN
jgi:hypothetical protein